MANRAAVLKSPGRLPLNAVIALCAGQGKRMGAGRPKMLLNVKGRPLLYWSLKNLESCGAVGAIVLAVPPGSRREVERKLKAWRLRKVVGVVNGGRDRIESTRNALKAVPKRFRWIGVHDGARAFVSPALVERCFRQARRTGAAILAVPSKDTIKVAGNGGVIRATVPRSRCWAAQTPQVFRRDIAQKIHGIKMSGGKRGADHFTDDASLAESLGFKVRIIPGSYDNVKVTTPEDLHLVGRFLTKTWRRHALAESSVVNILRKR